MNWLDVAIILVVIWFTFSAFHAGFLRETVTMVAALLGLIVAGLFYQDLADELLDKFIDSQPVSQITAFGILQGGVVVAGQAMALVLKPAVHRFQLGVFDQLAGAAFGFAKALVLIEIFLVAVITLGSHDWGLRRTIDESLFGSMIVDNAPLLLKVLPKEFEIEVDNFSHSI